MIVSTGRSSFMSTESDFGAAPSGSLRQAVFAVVVDRHQRAVVDARSRWPARRREARRCGPCRGRPRRAALLLDRELHVVAAGGGELDADLVGIGGQVAVAVLDLDVDQVAGLDLAPAAGWRRGVRRFPVSATSFFSVSVKVASSSLMISLLATSSWPSEAMRRRVLLRNSNWNCFLNSSG